MIDLYLYDREGNPLPGAVPTPLFVTSGELSGSQRAAIERAFNAFAQDYRLGLYLSDRRRVQIDESTVLDLAVNQGVFTAVASTGAEAPRDFYGGIVLRLEQLTTTGQAYLSDHTYGAVPSEAQREKIPLAGAGPDAVTGQLGQGVTDTLILQIARNGDLSDRPVERGLIKLYRLESPLIGDIASHNYADPRGYIVTADFEVDTGVPVNPPYRISSIYLAGRNTGIAPSPWSPQPYDAGMVRIYTLGFDVPQFAQPQAIGVVIVVWWGTIWVHRTGLGWTELIGAPVDPARVPEGTYQPFGFDFNVTDAAGAIQIECSGSNREGQCSSFAVRIGASSITGDVTFRTRVRFDAPAVPEVPTLSGVGSYTTSLYAADPTVDVNPGGSGNDIWRFLDAAVYQTTLSVQDGGGLTRAGLAAIRDPLVGGVLVPARPWSYYTLSFSGTTGMTNVTYGGDLLFHWDLPWSSTANITLFNTILGNIDYTFSSSGVISASPSRTWSATFQTSGVTPPHFVELGYSAIDMHRKRLAWKNQGSRSIDWQADHLPPPNASFFGGTISGTQSDVAWQTALVDGDLEAVAERENFLLSFGGAISYSGATAFGDVDSFCDIDKGESPGFPNAFSNVSLSTPLFGCFITSGNVNSSGIFRFWSYLVHLVSGNHETAVVVPTGSPQPPHDHFYADHDGTWNLQYGASTPVNLTVAQYEALSSNGGIDVDPVPGFWASTLPVIDKLGLPTGFVSYYNVPLQRPRVTPVDDRVYVDPRTDAWVAQSWWDGEIETTGDHHPSLQTFVGNEDSVTTLVAVLNEAAALAGMGSEYDFVFIRPESAKEVALL